jgi:cell division septal protein FtsQ
MNTMLEAEQRRDWMKSRRKMRKAARRARSRRQTMRFMLLAGLLVLGALGFTHLPWRLDNDQTEVVVHGNAVVTRAQIMSVLHSALGVPVYRLDPRQLEQN